MNLSKFFFKLFAVLTYIVRLMLVLLPVAWVIVQTKEGGWKYGFTFIQNNFEVALFVSFAIAFLISLYHALSFDVIEGAPTENYLKVDQKVKVRGNAELQKIYNNLKNNEKRYKNVVLGDSIIAERKVIFLPPDKVEVRTEGDLFQITSQPFRKWWFIDFGRNFGTVKDIAKLIKSKSH